MSGSNTRRETFGDGGRDVAGEKTPTPESSRLPSDVKYSINGTSDGVVCASGTSVDRPLSLSLAIEKMGLWTSSFCFPAVFSRDALRMCMLGGSRIACIVCLSLVDALTTSTTPNVRAIVYEEMSIKTRITIGNRRTKASTRKVPAIFDTTEYDL